MTRPPTTPARVGLVGAGRLGLPMVERLVAAGHEVTVHARSESTRAALAALDVTVTDNLAGVAHDRELVLVCVYDDEQLAAVADPLAAALPAGGVLASHVTGSPTTLHSLAARFPDVGVVDAPVSGTADDIRAGRLTVLLGGDTSDRARVGAVVSAYATAVVVTGGLGSALATKLVNNLLFGAQVELVAQAARIGADLGIEEPALLDALTHMSGGSTAVRLATQRGGVAALVEAAHPFLVKDVAACAAEADRAGVDLDVLLRLAERGLLSP